MYHVIKRRPQFGDKRTIDSTHPFQNAKWREEWYFSRTFACIDHLQVAFIVLREGF